MPQILKIASLFKELCCVKKKKEERAAKKRHESKVIFRILNFSKKANKNL